LNMGISTGIEWQFSRSTPSLEASFVEKRTFPLSPQKKILLNKDQAVHSIRVPKRNDTLTSDVQSVIKVMTPASASLYFLWKHEFCDPLDMISEKSSATICACNLIFSGLLSPCIGKEAQMK